MFKNFRCCQTQRFGSSGSNGLVSGGEKVAGITSVSESYFYLHVSNIMGNFKI